MDVLSSILAIGTIPRVKIGQNPLQWPILHRSCATSFITIRSSRESAITREEELAESRKTWRHMLEGAHVRRIRRLARSRKRMRRIVIGGEEGEGAGGREIDRIFRAIGARIDNRYLLHIRIIDSHGWRRAGGVSSSCSSNETKTY